MISKMIWIRQVMQLKDNQVDGSTETGGTGSILIDGILNEHEYSRNLNTTTQINDEKLQISYVIESYSDEGSKLDLEYPDFALYD